MSDDVQPTPEFPDRYLDQVLADPEAREALRDYARRQGIETGLQDMRRRELRLLAGALVAEGRAHQSLPPDDGSGPLSDGAIEIPAELVASIFKDPRARNLLKDIVAANGLQSAPADLPSNVKHDIARLLIEQGVITFQDPSADQ